MRKSEIHPHLREVFCRSFSHHHRREFAAFDITADGDEKDLILRDREGGVIRVQHTRAESKELSKESADIHAFNKKLREMIKSSGCSSDFLLSVLTSKEFPIKKNQQTDLAVTIWSSLLPFLHGLRMEKQPVYLRGAELKEIIGADAAIGVRSIHLQWIGREIADGLVEIQPVRFLPDLSALIRAAVERKKEKTYPDPGSLVLLVELYDFPWEEEDLPKIQAGLSGLDHPFPEIWLASLFTEEAVCIWKSGR